MDYKGNTEKGWASEALSLVTIGQVMTGSMWQKETSTTQGPPSRSPSSCGQEHPWRLSVGQSQVPCILGDGTTACGGGD